MSKNPPTKLPLPAGRGRCTPPDPQQQTNRSLAGRYLSYQQLSELTGLPVGSLRNLKSAGKLQVKAFRLGSQRVVFDFESAVKWIEMVPA